MQLTDYGLMGYQFLKIIEYLLNVIGYFTQIHVHSLSVPLRLTVMILSFRTDMPGQTVQTQIRRLLEEQSDLGLHCLPFCLHRLDSLLYGRAT